MTEQRCEKLGVQELSAAAAASATQQTLPCHAF